MTEYAANCPVSWPLKISGLQPEVDLNGVFFSYQWGLVYNPSEEFVPIRTPIGY